MTLTHNDQNLLMYAHGELSAPKSLLTKMHLNSCAQCRNRLANFQNTSAIIAGAIRDPGMPRWHAPRTASPGITGHAMLLTVLIVAVVMLAGILASEIHTHFFAAPFKPVISQPCAPGLPNDQCR